MAHTSWQTFKIAFKRKRQHRLLSKFKMPTWEWHSLQRMQVFNAVQVRAGHAEARKERHWHVGGFSSSMFCGAPAAGVLPIFKLPTSP